MIAIANNNTEGSIMEQVRRLVEPQGIDEGRVTVPWRCLNVCSRYISRLLPSVILVGKDVPAVVTSGHQDSCVHFLLLLLFFVACVS